MNMFVESMTRLLRRLVKAENRITWIEQAIRAMRAKAGGGAGAGSMLGAYGGLGSSAYGHATLMWVEIGSEIGGGVYSATPKIISGTGTFIAHPDLTGTIHIWRDDLGTLTAGRHVLVYWGGKISGTDQWVVVGSVGGGSGGIRGKITAINGSMATVQRLDTTGPNIQAFNGASPWHWKNETVYVMPVDKGTGSIEWVILDKIQGAAHWTPPTGSYTGDSSNTLHTVQDAPTAAARG